MGAALPNPETQTLLRLSTAGSVDDGKSTFIGRLLLDLNAVYDDTVASLTKSSARLNSPQELSLALVTDGLRAEQEQGITIDVAYRYFTTKRRRFILADSPGHEQYTRNMATAASTADLTIVLVDATKGILPQTKRHAFIASLMGVPRLLLAVNKMDLVDFSEGRFDEICQEFSEFAAKLDVKELRFIPISALIGENIVQPNKRMSWYRGETVLDYLEHLYIGSDNNLVDFRFPVQYVIRSGDSYRGYAGRVASGSIQPGDEVMILPSLRTTRIKQVEGANGSAKAQSLQSVVLSLEDEIDVSRGDMIVRANNMPTLRTHIEAMVVWMSEEPLDPRRQYIVRHTTAEAKAYIDKVHYRVEVESLKRQPTAALTLNEIGRVSFTTTKPLAIDTYKANRSTGNFILIDPDTFTTVAACMAIDRVPEELRSKLQEGDKSARSDSRHLHRENSLVANNERVERIGRKPVTIWFSGLSGSGKSTLAKSLERQLFDLGLPVFVLDGDTLRSGLNRDLGFSQEDRSENLRRAAEVAHLMNKAGVFVIAAVITPKESDRARIREILGADNILQVYLSTPLEVCEKRDPHGLYKKARAGEIREFTGVSSPFEPAAHADLKLNTAEISLEDAAAQVLQRLLAIK